MAVKKCCVTKCKSKSTRREDARVTYHKFPKDEYRRNVWVRVTRHSGDVELDKYVCSRHFLLTDFHHYQGRYVLKSGAVPSVFPWTKMDELDSLTTTEDPENDKRDLSTSSRDSDSQNLEAIKQFIAKHDKKDQMPKNQNESELPDIVKMGIDEYSADSSVASNRDETMAIASGVMDLIFNESTDKLTKNDESSAHTSNDNSTSVSLSVGSMVEARDFAETWYSAEIVEVDYDEMEVLVRYDSSTKKPEEWISVNSTRLRPVTKEAKPEIKSAVIEEKLKMKPSKANTPEAPQPVKEDDKVENKPKVIFAVGERCLARWRDNRRFVATIQNDFGDGTYGIMFDDGFHWKCSGNRLSKLKSSTQLDFPLDSRVCTTPSPTPGAGPSTSTAPIPIFHTHLFDPTRDYLGSKSERREQKRKLNIKEIFNIGQKQRKKEILVKEKKQKIPKEKKPRVIKKNVKAESHVKKAKKDIPVAIASIIGTINKDEDNATTTKETLEKDVEVTNEEIDVKEHKTPQPSDEEKSKTKKSKSQTSQKKEKIFDDDADEWDNTKLEKRSVPQFSDEDTQSAKLSDGEFDDHDVNFSGDQDKFSDDQDVKMSLDKIQEEDKLQNFEKPDDVTHEQVMDRIKEAISKLEEGLNRELNAASPKVKAEISVDLLKEESEINEDKIESPEVPIEINVEPSEAKPELDGESPEVNVESIPDLPAQIEPIAVAADASVELDVKSPKIETVKEDSEKPVEKVEKIYIKPEPSWSKIKKSKKRSKNLLKLAQRLKMLGKEEKADSIEEINTKLEIIRREMKDILKMYEKEVPDTEPPEGEWCCKWENGEPVGNVVDTEPDNRIDVLNRVALPRKTVQVEDKRLPEGWTKLMVRRSLGHSAGKWDVVLMSPDKRRFHTKTDMRHYLENNPEPSLKDYEHALMDFAVHLKLARRLGWVSGGPPRRSAKRKLMKRGGEKRVKKRKLSGGRYKYDRVPVPGTSDSSMLESSDISFNNSTLEDGYVYVGSLKVQVIDNLLRCPAESCFKNFRNNTLLQMHIKHYHRDLRKSLGATPKVLDLAYARTMPTETETRPRHELDNKIIKVKIPRPPKRIEEKLDMKEVNIDPRGDTTSPMVKTPMVKTPIIKTPMIRTPMLKTPRFDPGRIPRSMDSPMMRQYALQANRPVKRPRVLLPVRKPEPVEPPPELDTMDEIPSFSYDDSSQSEPRVAVPPLEVLDFETEISTHTVSKPTDIRRRPEKRKVFATISKAPLSEDEEITMNSDLDTRSSFPGSGTPDSKTMEPRSVVQNVPMSSESNEENMYMYTETGERIKLERMKREEIINCHCGFREEDGLMVQCELCLCWQHALCHNIQREADVPQKYTCSICLCPRRGRRSQRFLHDQDRMNEGLLPGAPPSQPLRRSHCVSANLLHVADALHALRVKYYVATKKNHPKLYLWAKDWDSPEATLSQDKPTGYSDLNVVVNTDKSRPRAEEANMQAPTMEGPEEDRFGQNGSLSNHSLLGGLLSSPGGPSLEMPISTSELERLAKSVQEQAESRPAVSAPQPEAAIENGACRERLLRHVQRCQALIDARLDTLEAEIIELESQDPSFEDDETADYFPRTKQTVQMLLRDLQTMQQLGLIT